MDWFSSAYDRPYWDAMSGREIIKNFRDLKKRLSACPDPGKCPETDDFLYPDRPLEPVQIEEPPAVARVQDTTPPRMEENKLQLKEGVENVWEITDL